VGRTTYYCPRTIRTKRDEQCVAALRTAHEHHPFYGVERLAIHLGWSEGKTRRIRNLAGVVVPAAAKKRRYRKGRPEIAAPPNILHRYARFKGDARPQYGMDYSPMVEASAWVQDFTYLWFERSMHYLAVVLDLKTRQIVGWRLGTTHSSELTLAALLDALSKHLPPAILHSDQGSEYLSAKHQELCARMEIQLSASAKASPWQNGFMERWFGNFKREFGSLNQFKDLSQLHEAIAMHVYYYNHKRIHSSLGMSPAAYAARLKSISKPLKSLDRVFAKVRG
jgi:putative transposase